MKLTLEVEEIMRKWNTEINAILYFPSPSSLSLKAIVLRSSFKADSCMGASRQMYEHIDICLQE